METVISKSKFKARAFHYFRQMEKTRKGLVVTDDGKPVSKIVPYTADPAELLKPLRNSVLKYDDPTAPVGLSSSSR